jgi:enhancer of yellow 2 transcription factor
MTRLTELLRLRLIECGWKEEVKELCKSVLKQNTTSMSVDKLVGQVTPKAKSLIPEQIKTELLAHIRTFLQTID